MSSPTVNTNTAEGESAAGDFHFNSEQERPAGGEHSSSSPPAPALAAANAEAGTGADSASAVGGQDAEEDGHPSQLYSPSTLDEQQQQPRPPPPAHSSSFNLDPFGSGTASGRRVSYPVTSSLQDADSLIWGSAPGGKGTSSSSGQRTLRAASDGLLLSTGFTGSFGGAGARSREQSAGAQSSSDSNSSSAQATTPNTQHDSAALFREHERRSLETSAHARLANASREAFGVSSPPLNSSGSGVSSAASGFFQQSTSSSNTSLALPAPPLLSPSLGGGGGSNTPSTTSNGFSLHPVTSTTPTPSSADPTSQESIAAVARATSASLHLGDLDVWMDEAYVRECCARMGWEGVTNIKMIRGSSPSSGYCFLTFPTAAHAAAVLARFNASPPTLMPRSGRTFKLNWGTGLPGLQPRWEGEYSVFVGDLGREVGEAELVSLFTPIFPSTKSAKVMCDPSTGLSRGYGFVRFADENDMHRALALGQHAGSGLSLHGRTLRISEASGPGNSIGGAASGGAAADRERSRTREQSQSNGGPGLSIQTGAGGYQQYAPHQHHLLHPSQQHDNGSPSYPDFLSPTFPAPYGSSNSTTSSLPPPFGVSSSSSSAAPTPSPISPRGFPVASGGGQGGGERGNHTTDPNNTTVFVGGLPACISEETLKSFFHHFGEITYCKIPTGKGCGFVQFVRRPDAELAIAKMNDFPIHGKSRIRLSWGRSQGDKQVEHVRKLASALGVPFEAVWRMVQGQDNTTIKQIASAVGGQPGSSSSSSVPNGQQQQPSQHQQQQQSMGAAANSRFESLGVGRMDLGAVASAAGLTESEVLDLVGGRSSAPSSSSGPSGGGSDFFARSGSSSAGTSSLMLEHQQQQHLQHHQQSNGGGGPYSRVSPSSFSAFSAAAASSLPLSPPPSANASSFAINQLPYQQHQHSQQPPQYASQQQQQQFSSPYTSIRPESYLVQSPSSPYERVDFTEGGVGPPPPGGRFTPRYGQQQQQQQPQAYDPYGAMSMQDSFANLGLHSSSNSPLPPPRGAPQHHHQQGDYYHQDDSSRYYGGGQPQQQQQDSTEGAWGGWDGVRA